MKQTTFASLAFESKKKLTRRERFLAEMDQVMPRLQKLIAPHYPKAGNGRAPMPLETMLRIYIGQSEIRDQLKHPDQGQNVGKHAKPFCPQIARGKQKRHEQERTRNSLAHNAEDGIFDNPPYYIHLIK